MVLTIVVTVTRVTIVFQFPLDYGYQHP